MLNTDRYLTPSLGMSGAVLLTPSLCLNVMLRGDLYRHTGYRILAT
jgi:hypothetical protein